MYPVSPKTFLPGPSTRSHNLSLRGFRSRQGSTEAAVGVFPSSWLRLVSKLPCAAGGAKGSNVILSSLVTFAPAPLSAQDKLITASIGVGYELAQTRRSELSGSL